MTLFVPGEDEGIREIPILGSANGELLAAMGVRPAAGSAVPRTFRVAFYPAVVVLAAGAHLALARDLAIGLHGTVTAGISLALLAILLLLERLMPYRRDWIESRSDIVADVVQTNVVLPLACRFNEIAIGAGLAWFAAQGLWQPLVPSLLPFAGQVLLGLLIAEFCYYWLHRSGHKWQGLWRFHAVHHGALRVYSLNAGRFHVVDATLSTLVYLAPLLLIGISPEAMALIATLNAVTGFLEHANVDFEAGALNRIFNTAQLHRWHHVAEPGRDDCNFGKVLSIWDQAFGTWRLPAERLSGPVGLRQGEPQVPGSFWAQVAYPWRRFVAK
jgi:sterol desaturase/sphingolipid hydroxylase (fatty acid hydroxylase superfamily)